MNVHQGIDEALLTLFNTLEDIEEHHDELTDTDVREALHLTLNYFFVWGRSECLLPATYCMFTSAGDKAVSAAVEKFLDAASRSQEMDEVSLGRARLNVVQNEMLKTRKNRQYDEFIGHVDKPLPPEKLPAFLYEPAYEE